MENDNVLEQGIESQLSLTVEAKNHLYYAARWAKFLAILGFVGCGIMVIVGIFSGAVFNSLSGTPGSSSPFPMEILSVVYLLMAALYFFPSYYLYQFADKSLEAVRNNGTGDLETALKNQKACYRFIGILTIITLSVYLLAILFAIGAGALMR